MLYDEGTLCWAWLSSFRENRFNFNKKTIIQNSAKSSYLHIVSYFFFIFFFCHQRQFVLQQWMINTKVWHSCALCEHFYKYMCVELQIALKQPTAFTISRKLLPTLFLFYIFTWTVLELSKANSSVAFLYYKLFLKNNSIKVHNKNKIHWIRWLIK